MQTKLKKGTRLFAGDQPIELVTDTDVEFVGVAEKDFDGLAAAMSNASHTIYGAHVAGLAHEEVAQRDVEGKGLCDVDLVVTYGAHGARNEVVKGEPRPVKKLAAALPRATAPSAPVEKPDVFGADFPGYAQLTAVGITKRSELKGKTVEELETVPGIVPEIARRISIEVNGALTPEEVTEIEAQSRVDVQASHAATAAEEAERAKPATPVGNTSAPSEPAAPVESPAVEPTAEVGTATTEPQGTD